MPKNKFKSGWIPYIIVNGKGISAEFIFKTVKKVLTKEECANVLDKILGNEENKTKIAFHIKKMRVKI